MTSALSSRLAEIRERIGAAARRAGRSPADIAVVAVTKGFAVDVVREALEAGLDVIGENRAQELLEKHAALTGVIGGTGHEPSEWHFLGTIQRNKVARLAPLVTVWHSIDRSEIADAVAARAPGARVFIQVNVGGEAQKGGCDPAAAGGLVDRARAAGLAVEGLMTVPPAAEDPRPHFARLRVLAGEAGLASLSMGMSGDFEIAVEEGATVVRLGSALFGPRPR